MTCGMHGFDNPIINNILDYERRTSVSGKLGVTGEATSEPAVPLQSNVSAEAVECWHPFWDAPTTRVPLILVIPERGMAIGYWDGESWRADHDNGYLPRPRIWMFAPRKPSDDLALLICLEAHRKNQRTSIEERSDTELPAPSCQPDTEKLRQQLARVTADRDFLSRQLAEEREIKTANEVAT